MKRILVLIAALCLLMLSACGNKVPTWQEQYDLGVRYLEEGNYEEAIIAFTAAIEIDPKQPEAYLGAAEAYIAVGDNQNARKILQQGFDLTNDAEIQSHLDEISMPENLTGQDIFTPSDLDDWDYPYGLDTYAMAERGICEQKDIDEFLNDRADPARIDNYYNTSNIVKWHPEVSVYLYNGLISSVNIRNKDTDVGPRGIHIGMSLDEVLNRFYCANETAMAYAQSLDLKLIPEVGPDSASTLDLYTQFPKTDEWKEGAQYWAYMVFLDESSVRLDYTCQSSHGSYFANCNLYIWFENGVVTRIHVSYDYDDYNTGFNLDEILSEVMSEGD